MVGLGCSQSAIWQQASREKPRAVEILNPQENGIMKQAKVLNYKKIKTSSFSWGWGIRALCRVGLRMLIACLPLLPFIALATPFLLSETPHLRISYTYTGSY